MIKHTLTLGATTALAAILLGAAFPPPAAAQFGNLKDFTKREAEKKAKREIRKAVNDPSSVVDAARSTTAATPTATMAGAPKPVEITQCDGLRPSKVVYGRLGFVHMVQGDEHGNHDGLHRPPRGSGSRAAASCPT